MFLTRLNDVHVCQYARIADEFMIDVINALLSCYFPIDT